jgi:hypothetical protein
MRTGFWLGKSNGKDHLEDLGIEGIITIKCIFKKWNGCIDLIYLAQDRTASGVM